MATKQDVIRELNRRKVKNELAKRSGQQPLQQGSIQNDAIGVRSDIPTNRPSPQPFERLARDKFGIAPDLPPPIEGNILEPAITAVTGAIAEPIAGVAGLAQSLNPFANEGAGARAVESTREALTVQPGSPAGQRGLQTLGETIAPVAEKIAGFESFLCDATFEATGSPTLAAAATTLPTALLEVIGAATGRGLLKAKSSIKKAGLERRVEKALIEGAPGIEQLKEVTRGVYKELDQSGVSLKAGAYERLVSDIEKSASEVGFNRRSSATLLPKSDRVIKSFNESIGDELTLTEIDNLRREAGIAAKSPDAADAAVGVAIINTIDKFLDTVPESALTPGNIDAAKVAPKFKLARDLWGRARRAELLNDAMEVAGRGASGFENGIVIQFRQILNNKKKSRFFKKDELKALNDVVQGDFNRNLAKLVGKFGFTEGHVTGLIGGSLGVAAGSAAFGVPGAIAVPVIGQVSKKLAQRLTRNKAEFANQVVRAGTDGNKIAKAYISHTPKKLQSSTELAELLSRPDIALDTLDFTPLIDDAANIAKGNKVLTAVTAAQGARQAVQGENQ